MHGKTKYFWECIFCKVRLGGKIFPNRRARIHLSGDPALRCGIVARVCTAAPVDVKAMFSALVVEKRTTKAVTDQKRKRADQIKKAKRARNSPTAKQSKLTLRPKALEDDEVDEAWGRAFFGLDIPVQKIQQPLFREAIAATRQSKRTYVKNCLFIHTSYI